MTLKQSQQAMLSEDYRERFKAEYWQLKIRLEKLHKLLVKAEANRLDFNPSCPISMLQEQAIYMRDYLHILEVRAAVEFIDLEN